MPTIWLDRDDSKLQAGRDGRRMAASLVRLWLHHRVMPVNRHAGTPPSLDTRNDDSTPNNDSTRNDDTWDPASEQSTVEAVGNVA